MVFIVFQFKSIPTKNGSKMSNSKLYRRQKNN